MMRAHRVDGPTLADVTAGLGPMLSGATPVVRDIVVDSREVRAGSVFVALVGERFDGTRFIDEAFSRGAVAALVESASPECLHLPPSSAGYTLGVPNLKAALPELARRVYGLSPAARHLVGVTGTNGKTTVAWLVAAALDALGCRSAYVGTLGAGAPGRLTPTSHTTPDALTLARVLSGGAAPFEAAALEVSSHALVQDRLAGLGLAVAGFLNLSHEHLDYHGTMDAYFAAKLRIFELPDLRAAFVNLDDARAETMFERIPDSATIYGFTRARSPRPLPRTGHVVRARCARTSFEAGTELEIVIDEDETVLVESPLVGDFHVENLLGAFTALVAFGRAPVDAARGLASVARIPGRLDVVPGPAGSPRAIVDYAHTPDALERVLRAVRALVDGPLTVVFGCGGDRDRAKRPLMGEVACRLANRVVVTTDNPRTEDPEAIARAVLDGCPVGIAVTVEPDRRRAIARAVDATPSNGAVVIAGKGHESWQEVDGIRWPFDDRAIARSVLAERGLRR